MKRIVFILVLSLLLGACERKKETVIRMETSLGNIRLKLYPISLAPKTIPGRADFESGSPV